MTSGHSVVVCGACSRDVAGTAGSADPCDPGDARGDACAMRSASTGDLPADRSTGGMALLARLPSWRGRERGADRLRPEETVRGGVMRRRALLFAVAAQLADAVTFVAALGAGVPIGGEVNPLARAIYPISGSGGVVNLKLIGVLALVAVLALGERWRPDRSRGPRFVMAGGTIIGFAGLVGAIANVGAALSLL